MNAIISILIILSSQIGGFGLKPHASFEKTGSIQITFQNLEPNKGTLFIALHNSEETFLQSEEPFKGKKIPVKNQTALTVTFDNLPFGDYAVSCYQDINNNDKLDSGWFKIPKEPWGMSNNPRPMMRAPKYEEAIFTLDIPTIELSIDVN